MPQRHGFGWSPIPEEGAAVAWSTREIAELAGTTVRAVRHYHEVAPSTPNWPPPSNACNGSASSSD
jgi:hypothetical protein